MRKLLMLGASAIFMTLGAVEAYAVNPNVFSWSPYAIMGYDAAPPHWAIAPAPMIERRAADTIDNPEGALNNYYKGVGLSDNPEDCDKGCAVSNGG